MMRRHRGRKGGWVHAVAPIAASVLGSIAPLAFNKIFGEGRKKKGGLSQPYAGRIKKGKRGLPPGLAAYLAKKKADKGGSRRRKAGAIITPGPSAGPLI